MWVDWKRAKIIRITVGMTWSPIWLYRLWSLKSKDTKDEYVQRKLQYLLKWNDGTVLKDAKFWLLTSNNTGWTTSINLSYSTKDQSLKFWRKNIENCQFWKTQFFWGCNLDFFFASSLWKSVKIYRVHTAWMGLNFDDYPAMHINKLYSVSFTQTW